MQEIKNLEIFQSTPIGNKKVFWVFDKVTIKKVVMSYSRIYYIIISNNSNCVLAIF